MLLARLKAIISEKQGLGWFVQGFKMVYSGWGILIDWSVNSNQIFQMNKWMTYQLTLGCHASYIWSSNPRRFDKVMVLEMIREWNWLRLRDTVSILAWYFQFANLVGIGLSNRNLGCWKNWWQYAIDQSVGWWYWMIMLYLCQYCNNNRNMMKAKIVTYFFYLPLKWMIIR